MLIFPATPVPSWTFPTTQNFQTATPPTTFDSGAEQRRALLRFSKRGFSLNYKNTLLAERNTLHDFYRNVHGMADAFWFYDFAVSGQASRRWIDEYVGRGVVYNMTGALAAVHPDTGDGNRTDETAAANSATVNDMTLMQASPAVNDAYYFGYVTSPWDVLRLIIGIAGAGTYTLTWEYWNGASWTALSNVVDGTGSFKNAAGTYDVKWDQPANMAVSTIKSISAYWVRARVSAFTSMSTQPKGTRAWAGSRYYDLHGKSMVSGDVVIYSNGVTLTGGGTDYTFVSGGGQGSSDRIKCVSMPAIGNLITSDLAMTVGLLRIKARLGDDTFPEEMVAPGIFNISLKVVEIQW